MIIINNLDNAHVFQCCRNIVETHVRGARSMTPDNKDRNIKNLNIDYSSVISLGAKHEHSSPPLFDSIAILIFFKQFVKA